MAGAPPQPLLRSTSPCSAPRYGTDYFVPTVGVAALVLLVLFLIVVFSVVGAMVAVAIFFFFAVICFFGFVFARWRMNNNYLEPMYQYAVFGVFVVICLFGVIVGVTGTDGAFTGFSISLWAVVTLLLLQAPPQHRLRSEP